MWRDFLPPFLSQSNCVLSIGNLGDLPYSDWLKFSVDHVDDVRGPGLAVWGYGLVSPLFPRLDGVGGLAGCEVVAGGYLAKLWGD